MKKSIKTFLKHPTKDNSNRSANPAVIRASTILFNTIQEHYTEFEANHLEFVEKGNKAAAGRARKHIGEIKKLVTGYRKESVSSCK